MKKTLTTALMLLAGSTLLFSCENCESPTVTEFTEQDYDWLVYERTSRVNFVNEKEETVEYKFGGVVVNNVPGEGYSVSDECIEKLDSQAYLAITDTTNKNLDLFTYMLKRPDEFSVKLSIENRGDWTLDPTSPTHQTYELDGINYTNVYEILPDSTKPTSVKQILFNKAYGYLYVEFYDGKFLKLDN